MRQKLIRFAIGFLVAGISGAIDALIIACAAPESFLEHWKAYAMGAAVLGMKGALMWFKQHEDDLTNVVNPRNLAPAILVAIALSAPGCATFDALTPGAPASAQQAKLAELAKYVNAADQALTIAATVQDVEIAAHDNGRISKAKHDLIQQAFVEFAVAAKQGLRLARDVSVPEATRFDAARSVGALGLELLQRIEPHLPPEVAAYLTSFRSVMRLLGVSV